MTREVLPGGTRWSFADIKTRPAVTTRPGCIWVDKHCNVWRLEKLGTPAQSQAVVEAQLAFMAAPCPLPRNVIKEEQAMSVNDAEPGDIYVDAAGKLWRCRSVCYEPTVVMEEVERGEPVVIARGGVSGLMWQGWQRIWRKPKQEGRNDGSP